MEERECKGNQTQTPQGKQEKKQKNKICGENKNENIMRITFESVFYAR